MRANFLIRYWLIGIIGLYLIFSCQPFAIIPDLLNLKAQNSRDLFSLIFNAACGLFGIIITIILLAFQFIRNISLRRKEENIFRSPIVANFSYFSVALILLALLSYIT